MTITEARRHEMLDALSDAIGKEPTMTLAEHLPPAGWADVATRNDIEALAEATHLRFEHVDRRFEQIDRRLDSMDGRLDSMDGRLDSMDGRLDSMDGRLERLGERLHGNEAAVLGIQAQLSSLIGDMERMLAQNQAEMAERSNRRDLSMFALIATAMVANSGMVLAVVRAMG